MRRKIIVIILGVYCLFSSIYLGMNIGNVHYSSLILSFLPSQVRWLELNYIDEVQQKQEKKITDRRQIEEIYYALYQQEVKKTEIKDLNNEISWEVSFILNEEEQYRISCVEKSDNVRIYYIYDSTANISNEVVFETQVDISGIWERDNK